MPPAASTAAQAVYADALVTARRFRALCLLVLFVCIAGQITLFFLTKFGVIDLTRSLGVTGNFAGWTYMLVYASQFAALIASILLSLTLVFIVLVMLSGRTIGVVVETKAFLLSLLLLLLLVPWQAVLTDPTLGDAWRVPGVLYTFGELNRNVPNFDGNSAQWLGWVRFVGWPAVALVLWLLIVGRGRRGVRQALGEDLPRDSYADDEPMN